MSLVTVEPRRRCACCRVPSNRCPCRVCGACSTSGGERCTCGAWSHPTQTNDALADLVAAIDHVVEAAR